MLKRTIMLAVITGLVFTLAPAVWAVDIEMVPVGWAGNEADTTGYGAVDYDYNIGKYEVTAAQWDAYITRNTGTSTDNLPRVHTPWLDMARFVNWLHNGQPSTGGTETGAYTIPIDAGNGYTQAGNDITREADWKWAIASEDEWYKAAYHKNDGLAQSYYDYPNSSDTPPTAEIPPGGDEFVQPRQCGWRPYRRGVISELDKPVRHVRPGRQYMGMDRYPLHRLLC